MCTDFFFCLLGGVGFHELSFQCTIFHFWPLSDAGRSSLVLHTNQGVNCVPKAITANCGAS